MRAVIPESLLAERRAAGLDLFDEVWHGVLHMVPPPAERHQEVATSLFLALAPLAERRGLVARFETGLFHEDDDYRVPDQLFRRPDDRSARGAKGAELVVEILSDRDETPEKIPWYFERGVREVLVIDPRDRTVRLDRSSGTIEPTRSEVLGVTFETVGGRLRLTWEDGSAHV